MSFFAVKSNVTGKYFTRARFNPSWDAAFQIDHPELWDKKEEAEVIAKNNDGTVIPFTETCGACV